MSITKHLSTGKDQELWSPEKMNSGKELVGYMEDIFFFNEQYSELTKGLTVKPEVRRAGKSCGMRDLMSSSPLLFFFCLF